ncbi:MAG: hypothetical protein HY704_12875 [Gemmatimonadetes bacterium]|nr:hypothetical protein [Gemmatimonadota bacterium]
MWQLILILALLIPILAIILDSHVGRAVAARLEHGRGDSGEAGRLLAERLAYLEGEVERLGRELQRLEEESQFLHKLLTEGRSSQREALPPGEDTR